MGKVSKIGNLHKHHKGFFDKCHIEGLSTEVMAKTGQILEMLKGREQCPNIAAAIQVAINCLMICLELNHTNRQAMAELHSLAEKRITDPTMQ